MPVDPREPNDLPRVVVLADSDSRWKWGLLTARQFFPSVMPAGLLLESSNAPSERQLADTGFTALSAVVESVPEFLESEVLAEADVIVLALPGGAIQAVLHGMSRRWPGASRRPLVITGYVGVVYEKHTEGLLLRAGADVILANCPADAEDFRRILAGTGNDPDVVVETTLPFLGEPARPRTPEETFTVVFAAQPGAPRSREDREYLLRRLIRHATLHPDREVLLKVRGQVGEALTHREDHPYQRLAAQSRIPRPENLRIVTGNMGEVLDATDLLVTVSSTAAVESMHRGIPTAILTDFGIKEGIGTHYFAGSGCYASFDQLDAGMAPQADPDWMRARGIGRGDAAERAREQVAGLLAQTVRPRVQPGYTMSNAPALLPGLLGRYGLTPHGHAIESDDDRFGDLQSAVRSVVSRAAKAAYRQGVTTVAPALRRLARL